MHRPDIEAWSKRDIFGMARALPGFCDSVAVFRRVKHEDVLLSVDGGRQDRCLCIFGLGSGSLASARFLPCVLTEPLNIERNLGCLAHWHPTFNIVEALRHLNQMPDFSQERIPFLAAFLPTLELQLPFLEQIEV